MKISVITATFNCKGLLSVTAKSIRDQTCREIEWVVIDGGSDDGTIDVIRENDDIISCWISEPDNGIYDAWNKAVEYVSGDWVIFLGAGDEFYSSNTVAEVLPYLKGYEEAADVIYGSLQVVTEFSRSHVKMIDRPWCNIVGKWEFFRPELPLNAEVFYHRRLFSGRPCFDVSYKIAGDTYFLLRAIKNKDPKYIPVCVTRMPLGGVSSRPDCRLDMAREVKDICSRLKIKAPLSHRLKTNFILYLKYVVFRVLGLKNYYRLLDWKSSLLGHRKRWTV